MEEDPCPPERNQPAPRANFWSSAQAAVDGGWGKTFRLIAIIAALTALIAVLGFGGATPIAALVTSWF